MGVRLSIACYDVLNNIAIQSILGHGSSYEASLVEEMISSLNTDDLAIFDRGYISYPFMARFLKEKRHFIIRCSRLAFTAAQNMFDDDSPTNMNVLIDVPHRHKKQVKKLGLPSTITIRLVKVILSTGEVEILATSLIQWQCSRHGVY